MFKFLLFFSRYEDAGYFYWLLAKACLEECKRAFQSDDATEDQWEQIGREYLNRFHESLELAEIYYAYHPVHRFTVSVGRPWYSTNLISQSLCSRPLQNQPFTSLLPEALFNMSRFLIHKLMKQTPVGVSRVYPSTHCSI